MDLRTLRNLAAAAIALLAAACAPLATRPPETTAEPPITAAHPGRYEALTGREPAVVAELRAAAPGPAEITDSRSPSGDEDVLAAKGYVHVADGYYLSATPQGREWLEDRAREAGADKVLIYAGAADNNAALHAAYYVKFKLPFGATFRDLRADERDALGADGVRLGAVIGDSPASAANLRENDVVLKVNDEAVRNRAAFEQQLRAHMGKRVTLTISRDGTVFARPVRLGVLATEFAGRK